MQTTNINKLNPVFKTFNCKPGQCNTMESFHIKKSKISRFQITFEKFDLENIVLARLKDFLTVGYYHGIVPFILVKDERNVWTFKSSHVNKVISYKNIL